MRGRIYRAGYTRGVTFEDQSLWIHGADTPIPSRSVMRSMSRHGLAAVLVAGALGLIVDGALLLLAAWLLKG